MKKLLVMLGTFWMAGCSTTPARLSDTHVMPVTIVNRYAIPTSASGHVIVYRDPGIVGGACQPDIYLNGLDVADSLPAGGRVDFFPPAGEYIISTQTFCRTSDKANFLQHPTYGRFNSVAVGNLYALLMPKVSSSGAEGSRLTDQLVQTAVNENLDMAIPVKVA
jgi:hypothetical protein